MNIETDLIDIDAPEVGLQNDGEPVAVVPAEPEGETPAPEPENEPETDGAEAPEGDEKPHKKTGSQRLREKLAREAEEKEYWKAEALKKATPATPATPQAAGKPRQEDFDTHEAWVEAVTDWKVDQKLAERETKTEQTKRQQSWNEKADKARAKFEDFDDALESAPAPTPIVSEVLNESPIGGEVAYHLATHLDLYKRINAMRPPAAALELGRLEAQITAKQAPPVPKAATKAPKPPTPIAAHSATKPSDDGRFVEY
jgi:hypothetical protein